MEITRLILTALLSVAALFLITKVMGHKQVSQLDFFNYVSGITIGSIGAELATELEEPYKPLIALLVYGAVAITLDLLSIKIPATRRYINGTPTVLIKDGVIYRESLKKAKLDLSELMLLCRESGYFDLDGIAVAVLEYNGRLSVLPKSPSRPLTPKDIGITPSPADIGVEVIMDGRVMRDTLRSIEKDGAWLAERIASLGYKDAEEVFLAVYHPREDKISVYGYNRQ